LVPFGDGQQKKVLICGQHLSVCIGKRVSYFTSSYLIDSDYQQLSVLWYNYGTKTGYLLHILTGNIFKELSAKVRKKSTHSAFTVLFLNKGLIAFWG